MKGQNKKGFGIISKLFMLAAVLVLIGQMSITANAQGTTKVTAESAKIRSSASTSSDVKASVTKDDELDVLAQTTDSNGYTWYKVYVNGSDTGYIRADLVATVEGSVKTESASNASESSAPSTNEGQAVDFVQVNESTVIGAKVTGGSVNVRSNPSTSASVAGKAKEGMEVTVSGEAADSEGKTWYQVSFSADGKNVEGFIRSDFLEVTATAEPEVEEEAVEEEPEEEAVDTSVKKEYEVVYEANPEGVEEWFLYDHNRGTKQSLTDLLAVVRQTQDNEKSASSQLKTFKILVIVMIAVILALIIGITLLIFKLRDSYEYEYEDDDDDEEDDEEDDGDEDDEDEDDEDDEPVVRNPVLKKAAKTSQPARTQAAHAKTQQQAQKKESSSWQSKNFLDIDDDMEFEFLDIK